MSGRVIVALALVCLLVLAGCTGTPSTGGDRSTTVPASDGSTTVAAADLPTGIPGTAPAPTGNAVRDDSVFGWEGDVIENVSVGTEENLPDYVLGHSYTVINAGDDRRSIQLRFWRDDDLVLNRTTALGADSGLSVQLYSPGNYTVVIDPADGPRTVIEPSLQRWDCNAHHHAFEVRPDGTVGWSAGSTMAGCRQYFNRTATGPTAGPTTTTTTTAPPTSSDG